MRVLVVAGDTSARTGVVALLSGQPGVTVDQAAPGPDLAGAVDAFDPDVIVWDLGSGAGGPDGQLDALRDFDAPVVVLGEHEASISEAVAAGARGAMQLDVDGPALLAALRAVVEGLVVVDPAFGPSVVSNRGEASDPLAEDLTARELEVLQWLAQGLSNRQIAQQLGISEHTVKFHVAAIFGKLDAHGRTEAVTTAARLGLIVL